MAKHITLVSKQVKSDSSGIMTASAMSPLASSGGVVGDITIGIKNILQENGLISKIYHANVYDLVFSTPISSKIIKIDRSAKFYYGDEWTSGNGITNQVQFGNVHRGPVNRVEIIYDTNFIFFQIKAPSYDGSIYIGKLSNGDEVLMGLYSDSNVTATNNNRVINISANTTMDLVTLNTEFSSQGKIFKQDIHVKGIDGELLMNNNIPATVVGMESVSFAAGADNNYKLANHYITNSNLHTEGGILTSRNSLLIELN